MRESPAISRNARDILGIESTQDSMQTIVTGIKKMLTTTDELAEWQLAMATAVLAMLPPVAVVVFMQRLFVRGLVETEK